MNWIEFTFPGLDAIRCAFSTRCAGKSLGPYARGNVSFEVGDRTEDVADNRKQLASSLGLDRWQELIQVHGTELVVEPAPAVPETPSSLTGDGLATSRPGQALVVKSADCQPILLAHASGRFVAALHCGWKGNRLGFPVSGVREFCQAYGLLPGEVMAVRGPSLGPQRAEFINFEREWGPGYSRYLDSRHRTMDLWRLTRDQLQEAGLRPENIHGLDLCTFEHPETFFSYRRERTCGRQASLIWIVRGDR